MGDRNRGIPDAYAGFDRYGGLRPGRGPEMFSRTGGRPLS